MNSFFQASSFGSSQIFPTNPLESISLFCMLHLLPRAYPLFTVPLASYALRNNFLTRMGKQQQQNRNLYYIIIPGLLFWYRFSAWLPAFILNMSLVRKPSPSFPICRERSWDLEVLTNILNTAKVVDHWSHEHILSLLPQFSVSLNGVRLIWPLET